MPQTLIVADDLSGAADCGIAFTGLGGSMVAFGATDAAVATLAIDADSRRMTETAAASVTARLFADNARPGMTFYKKMDSTLRGHVGAEIAAARRALAPLDPLTIVCPAFPATGRTMKGGRLYVNGTALAETEIGRALPHGADLAGILDRAGVKDARICDAETESDLSALVASVKSTGRAILWVGSGGLARTLAGAVEPAPLAVPPIAGPVLFLIGSQSGVSLAQAQCLSGTAVLTAFAPQDVFEGRAMLPALAPDQVFFCEAQFMPTPMP